MRGLHHVARRPAQRRPRLAQDARPVCSRAVSASLPLSSSAGRPSPGVPAPGAVPTPALLVDREVLARNVERMAARARSLGLELWPHIKTHKSADVLRLQLAAGAAGASVATAREAELAVAAGARAVLVAHPPVSPDRLARLVALARRARLRVALDSEEAAEALDAACARAGVRAGWLWEVDCGVGRCGTPPGGATAERVTALAARTQAARFEGVFAFGGHSYGARSHADLLAAAEDERRAVAETADAVARLGVPAPARSIGSTPTAHVLASAPGITEMRPGNYVFHDATQMALGTATHDDCALSVLATVVSRPAPGRLILDAGSKALGADRMTDRTPGFGHVVGHLELLVERLYEEHAIVTAAAAVDVPLGARLRVVPNHACAAANLHERMLVTAHGRVEATWAVGARGWTPEAPTEERPCQHEST
jgi:D-serine deaminase-like pyridoxal phosphate-dependent protein